MRKLTVAILAATLLVLASCGGTKKDEIDLATITDQELLEKSKNALNNGDFKRAVELDSLLLTNFPTSNLHIEAQLNMAEAYGQMEMWEEQMDLLHRLIRENIIPDEVPRIYVQMGRFYEKFAPLNPRATSSDTADYKKALTYYEMARTYKDSEDNRAKANALYRTAVTLAKMGKTTDALEKYQELERAYADTDFGLLAQIKLQDPSDTSELSVSDSALTSYRERLGLEAPAEVEETSVEQPLEDAAPADDNLDQLIEESRADTSAQQSPPMDMTEEIQEQNEEIPADTSGNQPPPPPAIPDSSGTY